MAKEVYSVDGEYARTGERPLRYRNDDPQAYRFANQSLKLEPGSKYRISAWIRTEGLECPKDSGAMICLQWNGPDGKYLGGCFAKGVKGTEGWTRITATHRTPEDARSFTFSCYARRSLTGRAWYDDVAVEKVFDPPLQTVLLSMEPRPEITWAGPKADPPADADPATANPDGAPGWLHWTTRRHHGKLYLIVVSGGDEALPEDAENPVADPAGAPRAIAFRLPGEPQSVRRLDTDAGPTIDGRVLRGQVAPLGVLLYEIEM